MNGELVPMTYGRQGFVRRSIAGTFAVSALLAAALPAGAQTPSRTRTVTYEAVADGSGVRVVLAPGGTAAFDQGGGISTALVDQQPIARGSGIGVKGVAQTTASTDAPPDDPPQSAEGGGFTNLGPAGVLTISGDGGKATSVSEAKDGSPSTSSTAELAKSTITAGASVLSATVEISRAASAASAKALGTQVGSASASGPVTVTVKVAASVLQALPNAETIQTQLCAGLTQVPAVGAQLGTACNSLFDTAVGEQTLATIEVGEGSVACTWDGETPAASGKAASVKVSFLGVPLPSELSQGAATTLGAGTPVETTVGAGAFSKTETPGAANAEDSVSGIAGGAFADLFGRQIQLRFSASSCGIQALVTIDDVLAATGGRPLLPIAGGALLVAGAVLLRRVLRRRDELV